MASHGLYDPTPPAVGRRLRLARKALGLRAVDMYRPLGIPPTTWSNWEQGLKRISIDEAVKIAANYRIDANWLYIGLTTGLDQAVARRIAELQTECEDQREDGSRAAS